MELKYRCLVLDHDDTVVNSTATVHYPCFVEYMEKYQLVSRHRALQWIHFPEGRESLLEARRRLVFDEFFSFIIGVRRQKAEEAGKTIIACSSTGNAASSLAGNAAAAGLSTYIFVPSRAPKGKVAQLLMFGATVVLVEGSYEDTFRLSAEAIDRWGWYNRNAAINPFLMEGKKTVSLEIAEQLQFRMPDYVALSVGDGCTIAGVWKGFRDLFEAGFIDRLPRLISVQASGCCPINTAAAAHTMDWNPQEENTIADSIAVGVPRNPVKALRAIEESHGVTVNVSDEEILAAMRMLGRYAGVFAEPAGAAGSAGLKKAVEQGLIEKNASVVSIVTGNGLKDVNNAIRAAGEPIAIPADMDCLLKAFDERGISPA